MLRASSGRTTSGSSSGSEIDSNRDSSQFPRRTGRRSRRPAFERFELAVAQLLTLEPRQALHESEHGVEHRSRVVRRAAQDVVRRRRGTLAKGFDQPALADPRLAGEQHQRTTPGERLPPARLEPRKLVHPVHEGAARRAGCAWRSAAALAPAHLEEVEGLGDAAELCARQRNRLHISDEGQRGVRHHNGARPCGGLNARRHMQDSADGRVSLAGLACAHLAGDGDAAGDADTDLERDAQQRRETRIEVGDAIDDLEPAVTARAGSSSWACG